MDEQVLHRTYHGRAVEKMPVLREDGLLPVSVPYVLLQGLLGNGMFYPNFYTDTGSGIAVPMKGSRDSGKFKICISSPRVKGLTEYTELSEDNLIRINYQDVEGIELKRGKRMNQHLTKNQVRRSDIWNVFCLGNVNFLNAVVEQRFKDSSYKENMGIFPPEETEEAREGALAVLGRWDWSGLDGGYGLDDGNGRLVGVAPEALATAHYFIRNVSEKDISDLVRENSYKKGK